MNLEKVVFGFFVVLAATLNFGFFIGDLGNPELHSVYELFAAVVVNLIATVLKFGDRTQMGAVHLATSLVASLQLIAAAVVWTYAANVVTAVSSRRSRRPPWCRSRAERCSPTWSPSCCWWSRPSPSSAARGGRRAARACPGARPDLSSAGVFLVLRRMRIPLIVLIVIFAVSVLGLSLMPGEDAAGTTRTGWGSSTRSTS